MPGPRLLMTHPVAGMVRRQNTFGEEEWSNPTPERITVADQAILIQPGFVTVAMTSITASRTHTLPPSTSVKAETIITVCDESGSVSGVVLLGAIPASGDKLNGSSSAITTTTPYGILRFRTNGAGGWFQA